MINSPISDGHGNGRYWYFKRDLSWLAFNERVPTEAGKELVPLLERLNFLAIFSSNIDELYSLIVRQMNLYVQSCAVLLMHLAAVEITAQQLNTPVKKERSIRSQQEIYKLLSDH